MQHLVYPRGIKRIAVCLYGTYRTGDWVLPYLKEALSSDLCEVDFFCSVKDFDYYKVSNALNTNPKVHYDSTELNRKLTDILQPKRINVITEDIEANYVLGNNGTAFGMSDAILQKQIYEAENNISYDIVFVTRYDALPAPEGNRSLVDRIVRYFNKMEYKRHGHPGGLIGDTTGRWIVTRQDLHNLHHQPWGCVLHDYFFYGSNQAVNALGIELVKYNYRASGKGQTHYRTTNIHEIMYTVLQQLNIPVLEDIRLFVRSTIIRPFADLTADPTKADEWEILNRSFGEDKFIPIKRNQ